MNTFTRGKNNRATRLFALFYGCDTTNLYGTIAIDEKVIIGDKDLVLEVSLSGSCHADASRKVNGEWSGGYESERSGASIDLRGESTSNGGTCCTTTDDNNALAGSLGHFRVEGGDE